MARIRSIKPEFWTSETVASLCPVDRLLFIGLWNYADDHGRGVDNSALVKAAVFPLDVDIDVARVDEGLASLHESGLIERYVVDSRRLLHVSSWGEHQRVSHASPSRFPDPDQGRESLANRPERLAKVSGTLPTSRARAEQGKEQGKEQGASKPEGCAFGLRGILVDLPESRRQASSGVRVREGPQTRIRSDHHRGSCAISR